MADPRYKNGIFRNNRPGDRIRATQERAAAIEAAKPVNHGWQMLPGFDDKGRIVYAQFGYELRYIANKGQWCINLPGATDGELIPGHISDVTEVVRQMAQPPAREIARIEAGEFWAVQMSDGTVSYEDKEVTK